MNVKKGLGQYDQEYSKCSCFWGTSPSKYVKLLLTYLKAGDALDLGAGEGKNTFFLAENDFSVVAVECSDYAIKTFLNKMEETKTPIKNRINILKKDVRKFYPKKQFNVVIAYGLLHCLPSKKDAFNVVEMMKDSTADGGYNVIATFTPTLPIPKTHSYLEPTFLSLSELLECYNDWIIIKSEEEIILETHPTSIKSHKHSICRLLTRKG